MDLGGLWLRHRAGEREARAALIETYAGLACRIASSMQVPTGALAGRDDLESAAFLGLIQAIDRYDPERGVPFEAFAALRIRGAILDELRLVDDRTREERAREREAEEGDVAARTLSLDALIAGGGAEIWLADAVLDDRFDLEDLQMRVQDALRTLSDRQRELLGHRYGGAATLRVAARRMGISEARASQLHTRAIELLRRNLVFSAA